MSGVSGAPVVRALAVTAVKGTRLLQAESIELTRAGAQGNREFFVIDERDHMRNGKQLGALQTVIASYTAPELTLVFPDGRQVSGPVELGDAVNARFYSRTVQGRLVLGPWSEALSAHVGESVRLLHGDGAVDRGARGGASLISRASVARLASEAGEDDVDARRFRMLIEIDGVAAHEEDGWVGRTASIGEARIRWGGHVGRCLVTSRDPETGCMDLPTLDLLREYRAMADTSEPLPFGIYGKVVRPGAIKVGDPVLTVA